MFTSARTDCFGDPPLATAFLDRLVNGTENLKFTGHSYRVDLVRRLPETSEADWS